MKYPQVVPMPTAVSDWLEEQLDARGIDSVVYTRYILSLLHRDSTDVICPDQDSCFTHSCKEVRRSGASRKRFRRPNDWWTYDQADVDQLRRSAAVECLMSASDQKYGIESLVDELCEKLNNIKNDSNTTTTAAATETANIQKHNNYNSDASPQELANRYYAAFPPLSANSPGEITVIPTWIGSPKKKAATNLTKNKKMSEKSRKKPRKMDKQHSPKSRFVVDWEKSKNSLLRLKKEEEPMDVNPCKNNNKDDDPWGVLKLLDEPESTTAKRRVTNQLPSIPYAPIVDSIWTPSNADNQLCRAILNAATALEHQQPPSAHPKDTDDFILNGWPAEDDIHDTTDGCFRNFTWDLYESMRFEQLPTQSGCDKLMMESLRNLGYGKGCGRSAFALVRRSKVRIGSIVRRVVVVDDVVVDGGVAVAPVEMVENLFTSPRTHFKPIVDKGVNGGDDDDVAEIKYADGTTFNIPNSLDAVKFKRSESGTMVINSDFGYGDRYKLYRSRQLWSSYSSDFIPKFKIHQNDIACQADIDNNYDYYDADADDEVASYCPPDCLFNKSNTAKCPQIQLDDDDDDVVNAVDDGLINNNNNSSWNDFNSPEFERFFSRRTNGRLFLDDEIWGNNNNNRDGGNQWPNQEQAKFLRDAIRSEEDKLNADAREKPWEIDTKRRQSNDEDWSFATRLKEDCLIQMSSLSTLRSVTL